jgi:hypothetical protein
MATAEIICAGLRRFDVGHDLIERLIDLRASQHVFENQRSIALDETNDLIDVTIRIESRQLGH